MDNLLEKKILEEIEKSGFPLELDIVQQLRQESILTFSNISYQNNNGFINELDIISSIYSVDEWNVGPSGIQFIIECKKTDKYPWIFFEEVYNPINLMGMLSKADYSTDFYDGESEFNPLVAYASTTLGHHHYNDSTIPIAKTYFEAFKKPNEQTTIYKAVNNLFHGRKYLSDWFEESGKNNHQKGRTFLNHYIIVLDGSLILASKTDSGFEVKEAEHILLSTVDTVINQRNKLFGNEIIIDVVHKNYFSKFLSILKEDAKSLNLHLNKLIEHNVVKLTPKSRQDVVI